MAGVVFFQGDAIGVCLPPRTDSVLVVDDPAILGASDGVWSSSRILTQGRPASRSPGAAKAKLLELRDVGFDDDMLSAWVRKIAFTRPLTAADLIDWRRAGIPQAAIKAAMD